MGRDRDPGVKGGGMAGLRRKTGGKAGFENPYCGPSFIGENAKGTHGEIYKSHTSVISTHFVDQVHIFFFLTHCIVVKVGPHKPNTCTNCRPFKLCFTIHVFPVQWINLRTKGRSRYGEPCLRGYSQHLHGRF